MAERFQQKNISVPEGIWIMRQTGMMSYLPTGLLMFLSFALWYRPY
ncbi:hypothetical protein QO179_22455 [Bacillus stercoris]|nr:hypothetical protein [Bacillus stercoris]